tara:strand:+ start:352 stop:603 length:252 start_codon:yes stop_codon:yes gene_type:complete
MSADEIAEQCGFDSAWDMLKTHMTTEELLDILSDLLYDDTIKGSDVMSEMIRELAYDKHEWFDRDAAREAYEDAQYQAWKDER